MQKKNILHFLTLFVLLIFLVSCEKNDNENNNILVSAEKIKTVTSNDIKTSLTVLKTLYPQVQSLIDNSSYNINVYKIIYKTHFNGGTIHASGIISVPESPEGFPLLSFQNGTNTLKSHSPSIDLLDPMYTFLQYIAGNGFIVMISDYIGFGESSDYLHPYYHRASNDAAIMDMIKATEEFLGSGETSASDDDRLFLMGYSQGAWATLSALNTLENSGSSNTIVSVSCGSGVYNIFDFTKYLMALDEYPAPYYLPYFVESHIRYNFMDGSLNKYFKEPYASRIPVLFNGEYSGSKINSELTKKLNLLLTDDFKVNFESSPDYQSIRNELIQNSVMAWATSTNILFMHGTTDDNIPFSQSENIYNEFIQIGVPQSQVKLITIEGKNHDSAIFPWGIETFNQFNIKK